MLQFIRFSYLSASYFILSSALTLILSLDLQLHTSLHKSSHRHTVILTRRVFYLAHRVFAYSLSNMVYLLLDPQLSIKVAYSKLYIP